MAKYKLLDIPLKQSFANEGLIQRVPYQLPEKEDDLNWLEGFTDAFQRPVLPQADAGSANGRYIKMGQLNQILQNLSQSILNVKQSLDNVSGVIDNDLSVKIDKAVTDANKATNNRTVSWLQTTNNQNCAGLKNFTGVNIDNFKKSPQAVANLEWCNYVPFDTFITGATGIFFNFTCTLIRCIAFRYMRMSGSNGLVSFQINNTIVDETDDDHRDNPSFIQITTNGVFLAKGDVVKTIIAKSHFYKINHTTYI